jgi:hypothetical protein
MEGKSIRFKRFVDLDFFGIKVATRVANLSAQTFGFGASGCGREKWLDGRVGKWVNLSMAPPLGLSSLGRGNDHRIHRSWVACNCAAVIQTVSSFVSAEDGARFSAIVDDRSRPLKHI